MKLESKECIIRVLGMSSSFSCDGNCDKAWGLKLRPKDQNGLYIPDEDLQNAPSDIKSGDFTKPQNRFQAINKWCIFECERGKIKNYDLAKSLDKSSDIEQHLLNFNSADYIHSESNSLYNFCSICRAHISHKKKICNECTEDIAKFN